MMEELVMFNKIFFVIALIFIISIFISIVYKLATGQKNKDNPELLRRIHQEQFEMNNHLFEEQNNREAMERLDAESMNNAANAAMNAGDHHHNNHQHF